MKKALCLLLAVLMLAGLAACGAAETTAPAPETPAVEPAAVAAAEPTPEPSPEPTPEPTPEPEPEYLENPIDPAFFDNAVFLGDSISGTLMHYANETGELGEALFYCEVSYSMHNAISGAVSLKLRGKPATPAQIIEGTGAEMAFIMIGINDIGIYGVEDTIECWEKVTGDMLAVNPDLKIYVQSCTPVYKNGNGHKTTTALVQEYNEALKVFCKEHGFTYIDVYSALADENGDMKGELSKDRFAHLVVSAGIVWGEALRNPANWDPMPVKEN